jgi:hypothetical protein
MAVTIKSDKKWHTFKYGYELPKKYRKEFDYLIDEEYETRSFAYYRRNYYDINEFQRMPKIQNEDGSEFAKWDGYMQDSYFSGILIKVSSDGERYKIGMFYS